MTETYLSLRKLENEAIKTRFGDQIFMGDVENPIKVSLDQFYGIEINDFAVTVAKTAQAILDARNLYPASSLADLYDELTMPKELRRAHQENDKAVMEAYGFDWRTMTESECVAELMKMYQDLVNQK